MVVQSQAKVLLRCFHYCNGRGYLVVDELNKKNAILIRLLELRVLQMAENNHLDLISIYVVYKCEFIDIGNNVGQSLRIVFLMKNYGSHRYQQIIEIRTRAYTSEFLIISLLFDMLNASIH